MNEAKRKHKIKKCLVCSHKFNEWVDDEITCPRCHTRYDLLNKKVDRSRTLIEPSSCQHRHPQLVSGSQWLGDNGHGRYDVWICLDCGEIKVAGSWDGKFIELRFELVTDEALAAVGKFRRLIDIDDGIQEPTVNHVTVTPEAKKRLMDKYGLTESDFVQVTE